MLHHERLAPCGVVCSAWEGSGPSPATYQMGWGAAHLQLSIRHDPEAQGMVYWNGKVGIGAPSEKGVLI